jgi:beta-lactamase regulating signal transducer with metallopeptidase domain
MLERIFLQVINMSYIASIVIVFILVARLLLAKAPKKYSYILWAVALVRLIVPISFESVLSLIPVNTTPVSNDVLYDISPNINTGMANIDQSISGSLPSADVVASVNPMQVWIFIGSLIWILGIAILLIYGMVSLIRMKGKLKNANYKKDNIYQSDNVTTPFVLGLIQPKIYLPDFLSESEKEYILLHEQTHIKRFDHIIRFISYLVLCIHWYNPLVWIAFWLSGKDMEMSCDESVINQLGHSVKKDYSQSLLNLTTGRMNIGLTPLAFGEGDAKGRIKNILNFKQPKFYIIIIALAILIFTSIGLLSNPLGESVYGNSTESITRIIQSFDLYEGKTVEILEIKDYDEDRIVAFLSGGNPSVIEFEKNGDGNYINPRSETHGNQALSNFIIDHIGNTDSVIVVSIKNRDSEIMDFSFKANEELYEVKFNSDGPDVQWTNLVEYENGFRFEWDYIDGNLNQVDSNTSDIWIQNPSKDPIEVVKSAIENQIEKDYTISAKFIKAVIDDKETQRKIESYKGSELAESRGWSDMYLMEHFLIVKASYFVEYDHEKTFMNDGNLEQYFYLTRDIDTGVWSIIDNSSSERTFKDSGEVYKNEEYGFTLKIPDRWEGKYKIQESEGENYSRVSFLYTGYQYENGSFQEFFSIMIYDEKFFNESESKNEELILAKDEVYVFYYSSPLDSGIDNEEVAEEFTDLNINHVEVKELFRID